MDNTTPHLSTAYDKAVRATIPYYDVIHTETIELIKAVNPKIESWLDCGCGTGTLIEKAAEIFPQTRFFLADPSPEMLCIAKQKLKKYGDRITLLAPCGTQNLKLKNKFDVVSAIQSHHYLDKKTRDKATKNCHKMLNKNGLYITFENSSPDTKKGVYVALKKWGNFQIEAGKTKTESDKHLKRFGKEYYPLTIDQHKKLLKDAGFKTAELFYYTYIQAGFYAIK